MSAVREACAGVLDNNVVDLNHEGRLMPPPTDHPDVVRGAYAKAIRALPLPTPALDALLAEARQDGMRDAAGIAGRVGRPAGAGDGCGTMTIGTSIDAMHAILAATEPPRHD